MFVKSQFFIKIFKNDTNINVTPKQTNYFQQSYLLPKVYIFSYENILIVLVFKYYFFYLLNWNYLFSIDSRWNALIHQLNGIFCTSILSMEPSMTTSPTLYPEKSAKEKKVWRYGQLSAESVCSENLKAWKKFLPCKEVSSGSSGSLLRLMFIAF